MQAFANLPLIVGHLWMLLQRLHIIALHKRLAIKNKKASQCKHSHFTGCVLYNNIYVKHCCWYLTAVAFFENLRVDWLSSLCIWSIKLYFGCWLAVGSLVVRCLKLASSKPSNTAGFRLFRFLGRWHLLFGASFNPMTCGFPAIQSSYKSKQVTNTFRTLSLSIRNDSVSPNYLGVFVNRRLSVQPEM